MRSVWCFHGRFLSQSGDCSVFEAEIMGFIIAMEMAARRHWCFIWIEADSTNALLALSKPSLVPIGRGIGGIIGFLVICKCSPLIYSTKEMVAWTSSRVMVPLLQT